MTSYNLTLDPASMSECEHIYKKLGLNLSTAINIFLRQSILHQGLPFALTLSDYNDETIAAIEEAEMLLRDPSAPRYSVEDTLKELKK